jgi:hypothetical protein
MIITEELRAKILLHLPKDYQKRGQEATGFSRSMIYKVLHEGQQNDLIAEWLMSTARKIKTERQKSNHKLSKIAQQLSGS